MRRVRRAALALLAAAAVACGRGAPSGPAESRLRVVAPGEVARVSPDSSETGPLKPREGLLIAATFDSGEKPNEMGGTFGAWNYDPLDRTQGCVESFSLDHRGEGYGVSMRLDYDVESENVAFCGFWMRLNEADLRPYRELVFYLKGDPARGFTNRLKVELKNNIAGEKGSVIVEGIWNGWTKYRIPLAQFSTITDWSRISEFVIVLDDETVTEKVGAILLDDVYFST